MSWGRGRRPVPAIELPPLDLLVVAPAPPPDARAAASQPVPRVSNAPSARRRAHAPDLEPGEAAGLRPTERWRRIVAVAEALAETAEAARLIDRADRYPPEAYDHFRRRHPVAPPPGPAASAAALLIVVEAGVASPFLLRETLRSLQGQSVRDWHAVVLGPAALLDHPVASFAATDPRIAFAMPDATLPESGRLLVTTAGTRLDPSALEWLLFAAERTGAAAIHADHDHGVVAPGRGLVRDAPWLYWAYDPAAFAQLPAPAIVLADAAMASALPRGGDGADRWRRAILSAAGRGKAAHVPRLLSTLVELPLVARGGRAVDEDMVAGRFAPISFEPEAEDLAPQEGRIAVVIPTRDGAAMLETAVRSLRATARDASRLDIVVMDNRSAEPATATLLERLEASGEARRLAFNQPFNWSLVSNIGARASDAEFIVFANNDIEMTARGWDDRLIAALSEPEVGAVGARLLYPDGSVQHGGIVFGMAQWRPEHEGRGVPAEDDGPNRRLVIPRDVASVTGAFLGCRRDVFDRIGAIEDETMFVGYSDIDFCMKIREAGLTVRYEPAIEAIHFESVTRGHNETKAQVGWDEGERMEIVDRWGDELSVDPGVNPHWSRDGDPFETLNEPTLTEILTHLDRTASSRPWATRRRSGTDTAGGPGS